jgi:hypothetical protein
MALLRFGGASATKFPSISERNCEFHYLTSLGFSKPARAGNSPPLNASATVVHRRNSLQPGARCYDFEPARAVTCPEFEKL